MHADFLPAEIDEHYHPEVEVRIKRDELRARLDEVENPRAREEIQRELRSVEESIHMFEKRTDFDTHTDWTEWSKGDDDEQR